MISMKLLYRGNPKCGKENWLLFKWVNLWDTASYFYHLNLIFMNNFIDLMCVKEINNKTVSIRIINLMALLNH